VTADETYEIAAFVARQARADFSAKEGGRADAADSNDIATLLTGFSRRCFLQESALG
jgi:hypothetical protein